MTDCSPRIVFMGTPQFAVASLQALKENSYDIVAVVTVADKPAGRGRKVKMSPVKEYALAEGLNLLQPDKLKDPAFLEKLKETNADIFVVVAFRMLPEEVWTLPLLGTFNLHASLLPQYRGAAPINHAIINGEKKTGVTTFLIDHEIDTGKILLSEETEISAEETAGQLHDRLMIMGADLVLRTVKGLSENLLTPSPQAISGNLNLRKAPKIFPSDTIINWDDKVVPVFNKIRGLSPHPGAMTTLSSGNKKLTLKIFECRIAWDISGKPGTLTIFENKRLYVACREGSIEVTSLQAEGRKRMSTPEFLRGFDLKGWQLVQINNGIKK